MHVRALFAKQAPSRQRAFSLPEPAVRLSSFADHP